MKGAFIRQTGSADLIEFGELPIPEPAIGQVRIRVHAASVNPIDTYIRSGAVAMPLSFPFVIGSDFAGVVDSVGPQVKGFSAGDRVWGSNQGLLGRQGTAAQYITVDSPWVYPLAEGVSFESAAACALVGITAHLGIFREARLRAGETILVIGGTGGVGSMVVQMAKIAGARVLATSGSQEKAARCRQLGADAVMNYQCDDLRSFVKELAPQGVDVFWETRREPDFETAFELLGERGRMILMAGREARPPFPVGPFYVKQCSLHGFVMFKAAASDQREAAEAIQQWLAEGRLQPQISRRMRLDQAAEAHRLQELSTVENRRELSGKIILEV